MHAAPLAALGHQVVLVDPVPVQVQEVAEARRVVRPGGWVFAAAIPRFARLAVLTRAEGVPHPYPSDWISLLEHGDPPGWGRFPGAHFHTTEEFDEEFQDAGLVNVSVCAVEGSDGFAFEQVGKVDEEVHQAALRVVRAMGHLPGVRDLTNHMMGIAQVA